MFGRALLVGMPLVVASSVLVMVSPATNAVAKPVHPAAATTRPSSAAATTGRSSTKRATTAGRAAVPTSAGSVLSPQISAAATAPGTFVPVAPTRLMDTRINQGATGPVGAHGVVHLQVVGATVPAGASAVVLNVTVTAPGGAGNITVYPDGTTEPTASNLNFVAGETTPNLVVVKLGSNGKVALANNSGSTVQLLADVSGYYLGGTPTAPGAFAPLPPQRFMDTRFNQGATGPVAAHGIVHLQITGGSVPAGASAVVLNVTVTAPGAAGNITVFPDGASQPTASNLNFVPGQTTPNLVIVKIGSDGKVALANNSPSTVQLIADVSGYYLGGTPNAIGALQPVTPVRLMDTRINQGAAGPVAAHGVVHLQISGSTVPAGASAVVLNVTVTAPGGPGNITVFPDGTSQPTASNLNFVAGQTTPNLVVVKIGGNGKVALANNAGKTVQLIADVSGYYLGGPSGASITGTVVDAADAPISGVHVEAFAFDGSGNLSGGPTATVVTAANGSYSFTGLGNGQYSVCFDGSYGTGSGVTTGYQSACYGSGPWLPGSFPGFGLIRVVSTRTTTGVNASLASGAEITGTISGPSGPAANVAVLVFSLAGGGVSTGYSNAVVTAANGTYAVRGVPPLPGPYVVCFDASAATGGGSTTGYADQCDNNVAWDSSPFDLPSTAAHVPLTAGAVTSGVNDTLVAAGTITGTVTAATGGAGVGGVQPVLYDLETGTISQPVPAPPSASNGTFTISDVPPGTYGLCFDTTTSTGSSTGGYLAQCYQGVSWDGQYTDLPNTATPIVVTAGVISSGKNVQLASGGGISGTITATGVGALDNISVSALDSGGNVVGFAQNAGNGTYTIAGLPAGTYRVCFDASQNDRGSVGGYLDQCYNNQPWGGDYSALPGGTTAVTVSAGTTHSAINATLAPAAGIAGVVSGVSGPLANVNAVLYDSTGNYLDGVTTRSDGSYVFPEQGSGTYFVCFDATYATGAGSATGYRDQCHGGSSWDGSTPPTTSPVTVNPGAVTTVNATLAAAAGITGTVTDSTGGVADVTVTVFDGAGNQYTSPNAVTDEAGNYAFSGLGVGTYFVCFDARGASGTSATGYADACYNGHPWDGQTAPTPSTATSVSVTALAHTVTGINAVLGAGGQLSGTVTDATSHAPLDNVRAVALSNADGAEFDNVGPTGADGKYTVNGIGTGNYYLCFDPSDALGATGTGYAPVCNGGVPWTPGSLPTSGSTLSVTQGVAQTGVNQAIPRAGGISGTVSDSVGGLAAAIVSAYDTSGNQVNSFETNPDGTYSFGGLAPGNYFVCVDGSVASGSAQGYWSQCNGGTGHWDRVTPPTASTATAVAVAGGAFTTVNFTLTPQPQWSTGVQADHLPQGGLTAVSCPTTTFCAAVDQFGNVVTYNGTAWAAPSLIDSGGDLTAVSCATATFCMAVDSVGTVLQFNGTSWTAHPNVDFAGLSTVSCPTTTFCAAADGNGDVVTYNGAGWSSTQAVDGNGVNALSCTSATFCVAVDYTGDWSKFNGASWSTPASIDSNGQISSVSCVSTSFCIAVDGTNSFLRYNGSTWTAPADDLGPYGSVSCVSTTFCQAVDYLGEVSLYNGTSWGSPSQIDVGNGFGEVSCASTALCVAVDQSASSMAYAYKSGAWGTGVVADPGLGQTTAISCVSSAFCMAVDRNGAAIKEVSGTWGTPASIDPGQYLISVSCPTASFCAAVDNAGNAMTYNGTSWTSPTLADSNQQLQSVSCVSATFCVAVDQSAGAVKYNGTTWSAAATTGISAVATVSCVSTTFCMVATNNFGGGGNDVVRYNGTSWVAPAAVGSGDLASVSCASTTFCVAVDSDNGDALDYNGTTWTDVSSGLTSGNSVSCGSTSFCVALDGYSGAAVYTSGSWSLGSSLNSPTTIAGVSCVASGLCTAIDGFGNAYTYQNS